MAEGFNFHCDSLKASRPILGGVVPISSELFIQSLPLAKYAKKLYSVSTFPT